MRSNIQPSRWLTHTVSQFVLSILLLHVGDSNTQQQECCSSLNIQSSGPSSRFQSSRLGIYHKVGSLSSRPIYQNENRKEFLFYLTTRSRGLWMIGPNPGSFNGGIANRADQACIENIPRGSWKYADGSGWKKDSELSFECHYDPTECLYSDDSILEGGDLYPARVRFVSGTFECIRLCSSTPGCRYWTVDKLMNETRHVCKLKAWKGSLLPQKGFVSGSLPKACHESVESSSPNVPTSNNGLPSSDDQACVYRNLEFEGGDLRLLQNVTTFSECRSKCSEYIECSLFSHHILRRECRLKSNQVSVKRNLRVSSGASIKTCKQVLSLKKRKQFFGRSKSEFKKYEDNEINGQFRITSEQWNPELENPESNSFQEMSATIKDSLLDMIMEDSDIRDKAKFDITIVGFSPGSVVCNFRINYILKEAYVAIPFIIKPKNVTNALLDNFKFKRGILFQRFVIASGSFKASSPVDHCDAMGCSHKCTYDYALQDYRCICPPGLYLDGDDKNCVEESLTTTTTPSNLPEDDSELPENCLLSPWTRWSRCSATCGPSSRSRARVVILPSKNGGSCDGELREEKPCNLPSCPRTSENDIQDDDDNEDDLNITTEATLISSEEQKAVNNAEAINFNDLKDLAPRITSYKIINGIYYFFLNNTPYYIPNGRIRVLPARNNGPHVVQYTRPDGSKETFELGRSVETPADASLQTSFKAVTPKPISLPDLMQKIDEVSSFYTLNGVVYFIINGIPFYIRDGKTNIVEDEDTGAPQIKYTYPEGRMSFIRLNKFRSNDNNEGREVSNPPVEVSTEEFERLLPDVEFYQVQEGVPYFVINGRPHVISPGRAEIVPSSEEGVYFVRVTLPDGSVSEIQIENDEPLSSSVPTIHSIPQSTPKIVDIQGLEQLIPEVTGFYFVGGIPYFFVKGKPYKVEPGKTEIVYGANGLPKEIKNVLPDGTTYTIDITGRSIPPITTQTTVTPRLEDDSSSASPPNQEDVSVLSQKTPEKITIQELEQLLPNISAYFEVNSEPRFVVNGTPYVVHPGITKVIPGDENSSPTISYTYPNGTTYDIQLGGSSVPSSSQSTPVKTITIDELEDLIPQMSAYYIKDGTPYFVIGGRPYKIEPGTTEVIQDEDSSALTVKHTSPDGTVYEIKLGSSQETDQSTISSTPGPLSFDYNNAKPITIEELEKRISEVTGYFIKDVETYFVLQGEPYVVRPGTTTITKGTKSDSLVIRHTYPNGTVYEISIGKSGEPQQNIPTELFDNQSSPTLDNRPAENIDIQSLKDLVPQITGYYILDGEPYFLVGPKAYRVEGGQTEIVPNEPDSSLTIKHTQPDGTVVEFDLGSKPRIQVSDKKSPSKDPYSVYGEPKSVTFDELKDLLSEFSGYYVKDGITYFIIGNKVYRVQPGSIKVIPDDDKSTISIEYTHPDGTKSVVQLATHSDDKAPVPVELQEFESLIPNLSGYYIKNGVPHFVIKDVPYVIQDGETEIIPKDSSAFTIRYTYPNGTIYDINVGTQSTELPAQEEKPEVISIEELKNLISQVTGYYEQDGITYFIINGRPHRVEPGSTAIKKNDDGALVIQHEFTNGTREEIKLSKEPDQVKTITIEELKDLIPQLTGYFVKNDVPHFIINGLTYKVSPGSTEVIPSEDGQSFVVKHISPEGLVTEINLGKSLKQQESPFDPKDTRELTIDELEKNIQDITGYYIKNGIPYFIINGVPHKISPGKTEIVENKDNPGAPLVIRHEQPDGSIKEIQLGTKTNEAPRKDPTEEITFDEFENQAKKISGYYMKDGEPFFIIDGTTKKISPGKTTIIQDDDNTIIKILHRDPNGTRREIELSTDTLKETEEVTLSPLEQQDKFVTKSIDKTATKKPITEIQYDDEENFDERVEDISIEELSDQLPNVQKYIIKNGVPYFFFNGVPKRVNSGVTEIIPNKEDGTFVVRNVSPEGEVKEIKYLPKSEVAFTDSTTAKPTEKETTLSSVDLTTLGIDKVDEITFDEFEKEVPNVSQYYIKDGVPHFVINGKPTKIQSGLTEVSPNDEDGSLTISHTYPDGSVKEISLSAQPIQTTQGLSTTLSASETTPLPSDTTIIEGVTTTEPTELFKEDEKSVKLISFDGLIKKLPEVTRYYINEGIPYFVIKRKPYKVSNGVTQVRPNDDGTISIVNINPNGVVKEAKISSDQLIEEEVVNIDRPNYISFEDLVKELSRVTRYYVSGGVPYFVINKKPYTVNSGVTQVKPNEDGTISVVNIDDNGSVKEARISSDQLSTENTSSSTDESRPQDTTPSPIEVTTAFKPQTSTNEVTVSVSPKPQEHELSTAEDISFEELEKDLPKVTGYVEKDGEPFFIIDGKPKKVSDGKTSVVPNKDDGSITISHVLPDGSVKEITMTAQQVTDEYYTTESTTASDNSETSTEFINEDGETVQGDVIDFEKPEYISFDDLVKELPNVNRYYVRGNVPYFIINNRPYRVDSGVTQVKPNEDGTISIININPDGSVKEAKVSSDQIKQEDIPLSTDSPFARDTTVSSLDVTTTFKSQGTSEPKDETTTSASDKPQETELSTAEDISFGELEKDLPKVTGYVEKDGEPFFIIDGKPKKVSDGKTSVVPNKDDGSITISHVLPDGSVKEITMTAKQVTDEYYTTESTTTSDNFETSTKLSKEDGEKIQEDIVVFEKPEYISFDDLVKELPNVNRYYVQEDIPYFVIDNKPYRVDSGITQVKPNEDGTISIININPDGSVKEAKVSSNQLTEEDIPSTTDRSLSQDTTTSALDVNTTFKTQASSESTDETTTSASKKQQTPELSSAEDISFEELEKDLPKVTGYFEKDGETYFIIDGKPKRVSDGKTSVVPNKEDGSITISHVLPDGSVKEITMIGISGENEEVTTTSSPLTEIPSATDVSTLSTIPGVILMNMSTPNTVISDITQSEARPITFSDLKARVPDINAYYVVDDTPYFVISGVPYYVNDGVTQLIPGDENSPFMIKFVGVDGTTDEIALENYDIIPGTVETGPNLSISTTEANELTTTSNVYPIAVSIQKLEDIIPDVSSYYVLNDTQYFVVKDQVYYVEDGSTVISEGGDDPDSLVIMHTFPNGTLYEIHLGKDQNSNKPISTTIEELEGILPGITGYYVIDGLPYFTIDDKTYYVDSGKTTLMPGDSNMPFTIHHVFPNGTSYDIALGGFRPKEQVFLRPPTSEVPSSDSTSTDKTISTTETLIHSESSTHTMPAQETTTDSSISFDDDDLDTTALTTEESFGLPTESTPHSDFDSTTTDITNESAESTTQGGVDVLDKTSTNAIDELSTQRPIQKETHESTTDKSNDENTSSSTLIPSTNDEQEATTEKTVLEAEGISIEELENLIPQITAYRVVDDIPYFFIGDKLYNVDVGKTLIMPGNDLAPFMIRHVFENGTKYDLDLGSYKINPEEETATTPNTYSTDSPLIKSEDDTNIQDDDDESTTTEASVIDLISMTTSPKTNTQSPLSEGSRPTETEEYSTTIINFISSTMKPLIGLDTTEKEAFNQETTTAPIEENVFTVLPTGVFTPNDTSAEQHEPSETSTEDVRDKQANDGENVFTVLPVDAATELPKDVNQATDLPKNEDSISTSEAPVTTAPSFKEKNPSPIGGVSLSAESYETTPVPTQEDYSTTHSFTSESPLETKEEEDETSSTVIPIDEEKQTTSPSIDEDEDMSTTPSPSENVFTVLPTDISNVIDDSKIQFDDTEESTDDPKSSTSVPTTGATPSSESVFTVLPSAGLPSGYTPSTIIDLTTLMSTTRSSSLETTSTASPVLDLTTMKTTLLSESEEGVVISKTTTTVSSDITTTTTTTTAAPPSSAQGTESLNCQVTAESCKTTSPTVPLNCKTADSSPITVLINREDINLQEVIDKNLKIIVKEFMLMPMPPMPADSSKR